MPSIRLAPRPRPWEALLSPLVDGLVRGVRVAGHVALALLIASGEAMRWVDYEATLVSAPMLRAVHVLAGFVLLAALAVRLVDWLLHGLPGRLGRHASRRTATWLLDAAWWVVLAALLASGLERYGLLRHGVGWLPVLGPAAWWMLHGALQGYLYALMLINAVIHGRMLLSKAYAYLYTP